MFSVTAIFAFFLPLYQTIEKLKGNYQRAQHELNECRCELKHLQTKHREVLAEIEAHRSAGLLLFLLSQGGLKLFSGSSLNIWLIRDSKLPIFFICVIIFIQEVLLSEISQFQKHNSLSGQIPHLQNGCRPLMSHVSHMEVSVC